MCFEAPILDGNKSGQNDEANDDDDLGIADIDENDTKSSTYTSLSAIILSECLNFIIKHYGLIFLCCHQLFHNLSIYLFNFPGINSAELAGLNESLQDLLDGIQVCLE
jgi:hypothetical protein